MTEDLVDTIAVAMAVGVTPSTIRTWANRGLIERRGRDARGRTLYSLTEVRTVHQNRTESLGLSEQT